LASAGTEARESSPSAICNSWVRLSGYSSANSTQTAAHFRDRADSLIRIRSLTVLVPRPTQRIKSLYSTPPISKYCFLKLFADEKTQSRFDARQLPLMMFDKVAN
jgi:hypothetical protein